MASDADPPPDALGTFDAMGQALTATDEMGYVTTFNYWPSGKVKQIIDARGYTYEHLYDAGDQLKERKYPAANGVGFGSSERWEFNLAGQITTHYNRSGQKLNYHYDNRGREDHRWWDGNAAPEVWTGYDAASRVTWRSNPNGRLDYAYTAAGEVSSEQQAVSGGPTYTMTNQYNVDGLRSVASSTAGTWVGYTYNARGEPDEIQFWGGSAPFRWAKYTHNLAGERRYRSAYNGTESEYRYDGAGRLNYLNTYRSGGGVLLQRLGYDSRDRRTWQKRDNDWGDTYEYQADSQLVRYRHDVYRPDENFWNICYGTYNYQYDRSGNRTSSAVNGATTTYGVDALNQYTSVTGAAISHGDGRGNLTQWKEWTYTYDADNRLTYAGKSGYQVWFYYDAQGRLSKLNRNGQWEYRYYDGTNVLLRTRSDGTWIDVNIWGVGANEILSRYTAANGWHFFHQDAIGSPVAITDLGGTPIERCLYDAYGQQELRDGNWAGRTSSVVNNPWGISGQEFLADLGLHNFKNRFYHAELGRFVQNDPIRFDGGDLNLYRYCSNDPFNRVDASGLANEKAKTVVARVHLEVRFAAGHSYKNQKTASPTAKETAEKWAKRVNDRMKDKNNVVDVKTFESADEFKANAKEAKEAGAVAQATVVHRQFAPVTDSLGVPMSTPSGTPLLEPQGLVVNGETLSTEVSDQTFGTQESQPEETSGGAYFLQACTSGSNTTGNQWTTAFVKTEAELTKRGLLESLDASK